MLINSHLDFFGLACTVIHCIINILELFLLSGRCVKYRKFESVNKIGGEKKYFLHQNLFIFHLEHINNTHGWLGAGGVSKIIYINFNN